MAQQIVKVAQQFNKHSPLFSVREAMQSKVAQLFSKVAQLFRIRAALQSKQPPQETPTATVNISQC